MTTITLTQVYLMGYGCKDCRHWEQMTPPLGTCRGNNGPAPTFANEICGNLSFKEDEE